MRAVIEIFTFDRGSHVKNSVTVHSKVDFLRIAVDPKNPPTRGFVEASVFDGNVSGNRLHGAQLRWWEEELTVNASSSKPTKVEALMAVLKLVFPETYEDARPLLEPKKDSVDPEEKIYSNATIEQVLHTCIAGSEGLRVCLNTPPAVAQNRLVLKIAAAS